ncbi:MAG: sugar transferase [Candidatus Uhrbacteria bacterium]
MIKKRGPSYSFRTIDTDVQLHFAMKRSALTISALLVPLDYLALLAAAALAYTIRFNPVADIRPVTFQLPLEPYLRAAALIAGIWIVIFALAGLYASTARHSWRAEFSRIVLGSSAGFAIVLAIIVFSRELFASRFIILAAWPLAIAFVFLVRIIVRMVERRLFAHGIGVHRIALIGNGRAADALAAAFSERPSLGFRIVHRMSSFTGDTAAWLERAWNDERIDEVIDATTPPNPDLLHALLDYCDNIHLPVRFAADLLAARTSRVAVETFAGVPLIEPKPTPLDGWGRIAKRTFDILASFLLIILVSPIMLLVAIGIALDSRGPVLFTQERIGRTGRPFMFLKFRSMRVGAEKEWPELRNRSDRQGIIPKIKDDPRVTRIGKFIRRWSLDELPQLFNVIAGSMSLVGPRPHLLAEVAEYRRRHRKVLAIRPGITGLAQVSGRADLDFEEEVKLDTFYIEHWSLGRDIVILLRTPFAILRTKGAY